MFSAQQHKSSNRNAELCCTILFRWHDFVRFKFSMASYYTYTHEITLALRQLLTSCLSFSLSAQRTRAIALDSVESRSALQLCPFSSSVSVAIVAHTLESSPEFAPRTAFPRTDARARSHSHCATANLACVCVCTFRLAAVVIVYSVCLLLLSSNVKGTTYMRACVCARTFVTLSTHSASP